MEGVKIVTLPDGVFIICKHSVRQLTHKMGRIQGSTWLSKFYIPCKVLQMDSKQIVKDIYLLLQFLEQPLKNYTKNFVQMGAFAKTFLLYVS